ncbi:hypothetical protein L218DRAFT_949041 [Marasmius fiardii PR-910]|nr:hypothetical protein L218DRAFT_949041 [Marasmius fiardii PR-910]
MGLLIPITAYILLSCITVYATIIPIQHAFTTSVPTQHLILQRWRLKESYPQRTQLLEAREVFQQSLRERMESFQEANHESIEESYLMVTSNRSGSVIATQIFLTVNEPTIDLSTPFSNLSEIAIELESKASLSMTNKAGLRDAFWTLDNGLTNIGPGRPIPGSRHVSDESTSAITDIIISTGVPNEDSVKIQEDMKILAERVSQSEGNIGFSWGWDSDGNTTMVLVVSGWRSYLDSTAWFHGRDEESIAIESRWKANGQTIGFLRGYTPKEVLT